MPNFQLTKIPKLYLEILLHMVLRDLTVGGQGHVTDEVDVRVLAIHEVEIDAVATDGEAKSSSTSASSLSSHCER